MEFELPVTFDGDAQQGLQHVLRTLKEHVNAITATSDQRYKETAHLQIIAAQLESQNESKNSEIGLLKESYSELKQKEVQLEAEIVAITNSSKSEMQQQLNARLSEISQLKNQAAVNLASIQEQKNDSEKSMKDQKNYFMQLLETQRSQTKSEIQSLESRCKLLEDSAHQLTDERDRLQHEIEQIRSKPELVSPKLLASPKINANTSPSTSTQASEEVSRKSENRSETTNVSDMSDIINKVQSDLKTMVSEDRDRQREKRRSSNPVRKYRGKRKHESGTLISESDIWSVLKDNKK